MKKMDMVLDSALHRSGSFLLVMTLLLFAVSAETAAQIRKHVSNEMLAASQPSFIRNDGQWDPKARFLLRSPGLDLWITATGVVYDVNRIERVQTKAGRNEPRLSRYDEAEIRVRRSPVFITFDGARTDAAAVGSNRREEYHNYFIGNDRSRWAENVPLFGDVRIDGLYDGVDAFFYLDGGRPRYDLVVAPGADPSRIRMTIEGARKISVGNGGALKIVTILGTIEQRELFAYQMVAGEKRRVSCSFVIDGKRGVRFDVGSYDRARPLVIDPLVYSTYLGGGQSDVGWGITVDTSRNAYVCGMTLSTNFPVLGAAQSTNRGGQDAFVTKLARSGARVYSTYLGGSGDDDHAMGIAVGDSSRAYITGSTNSTDFPTHNPSQSTSGGGYDAFVTKLTITGGLAYSTYLGGAGADHATGIDYNVSGEAYVAGYTASTNFPRLNAMQMSNRGGIDGFITKLSSSGARQVSTYIGGGGDDRCNAIEVDGFRSIYVTGQTTSQNFPVNSPIQATNGGATDLFLTRLGVAGSLGFSTYLGGSGHDIGTGIAVDDDNGRMHVTGYTGSTNYPTHNPSQATNAGGVDVILTMITNSTSLIHSTYLGGGSGDDYGFGIEVDTVGSVYITGMTRSTDFDTLAAVQGSSGGGASDGFVMKLTDSAVLSYSTYLGGNGEEFANGIAIDLRKSAYITGSTEATNFPTRHASQPAGGGMIDAFVSRLSDGPIIEFLTPTPGTVWCAGTTQQITWISGGVTSIAIDISSNGGTAWTNLVPSTPASTGSYSWAIPSSQTASTNYRFRLRAVGIAAVGDSSRASITINTPPVATITSPLAPVAIAFTDVTITSSATGTPTPTVRWQQSANNVDYANIPSETSSTLTLRSVRRENHPRYYRAVYTNSCGVSNSAAVLLTVDKATAPVVLGNLTQVYNGSARRATATTTPAGLTVAITYTRAGGPVIEPVEVGSYEVSAAIRDTNYEGSATGTLVITRANATIELSNLNHVFDGTPKLATATTTPPGLAVEITYAQSGTPVSAPTAIGSYDVTATVTDPNYQGTATGILVISEKASAPDPRVEIATGVTARVVPNPLGDRGEIQIEGLAPGPIEVTIHDVTGKALKNIEAVATGGQRLVVPVGLSELASGFYTARITTARGTVTVGMQIVR